MDEVTEGVLLDVREADMTDLLAEPGISTALNGLLESVSDNWNGGFNNSI
jgi:hypothetical protein